MGQRWHSAHQSNEWNCDHRENDVISTSNETQKLTVCIKCLPGVEIFWGNLAQYTGQPASGRRNFPIEKAQHQSEQQKTNYPQWSCHLRLNLIHCRFICWNENCGWCPISLRSLFFSTDTFQIQLMSSIMLGMTNTFFLFFSKTTPLQVFTLEWSPIQSTDTNSLLIHTISINTMTSQLWTKTFLSFWCTWFASVFNHHSVEPNIGLHGYAKHTVEIR